MMNYETNIFVQVIIFMNIKNKIISIMCFGFEFKMNSLNRVRLN